MKLVISQKKDTNQTITVLIGRIEIIMVSDSTQAVTKEI